MVSISSFPTLGSESGSEPPAVEFVALYSLDSSNQPLGVVLALSVPSMNDMDSFISLNFYG